MSVSFSFRLYFHIPELSALNAFGFAYIGFQVDILAAGAVLYGVIHKTGYA